MFGAFLLFGAAVVISVSILGATQGGATGAAASFAALIVGQLAFVVTRTPDAPWRPLRLALGTSAVCCVLMLLFLPMPPRGAEMVSAVVLLVASVSTLVASWLVNRAPTAAAIMIGVLGLAGVVMASRNIQMLAAIEPGALGPATVMSYVIAGVPPAAWISAVFLGIGLFRAGTAVRASS